MTTIIDLSMCLNVHPEMRTLQNFTVTYLMWFQFKYVENKLNPVSWRCRKLPHAILSRRILVWVIWTVGK